MESMESLNMQHNQNTRINPQKFALWIGMASIIMMFGAFTSAYIVKHAAGNWLEFPIPRTFYVSTVIIVLSSITLHSSYSAYKNQKIGTYRSMLVLSLMLGTTFIVCQYIGWGQLYELGVDLKANVSGSFFYLITGAHALHVLGGITAIIVATIHAFTLKFRYTEKRKNRFELVIHYWHFVGILWIYLLYFLLNN